MGLKCTAQVFARLLGYIMNLNQFNNNSNNNKGLK